MSRIYIGLGGNTIDAGKHLAHALRRLKKIPGAKFCALSKIYTTEPVGCPGKQRDYLNCVAALQSNLPPRRLHKRFQSIERRIQKKPRKRNAPRRVDIDYLLHANARIKRRELFLPHPRMHKRDFVLMPLGDVMPAGSNLIKGAA